MGLNVTIYSHCVEVKILHHDRKMMSLLERFAQKWDQFQWIKKGSRFEKEFQARYISVNDDKTIYRMHLNQYKLEFVKYYNSQCSEPLAVKTVEPPKGHDIEFEVRPGWALRPDQLKPYEYTIAEKPVFKMLGSQPGAGKSFMSMMSMKHFGKRVLMIFKPQYIDKWIGDFTKTFVLDPEDIMVVEGGGDLKKLLKIPKKDLKAKVIIISNATFRSYINLYEKLGDKDFGKIGFVCRPQDIWEHLEIGYRIIDEVHLDFHFNHKLDCYTNVAHSLSMSGTLVTKNQFVHTMHNICYPHLSRFIPDTYNRYIYATAVFYRFKKPEKIRVSERGSNRYSHNALEESILRHVPTKLNYLAMIDRIIRITFMRKYQPGFKLLIYVYKVALAAEVKTYLKTKFPNFNIGTYVEQDDYNQLVNYDIIVTNIIKAGAAQDIKGLYMVLQTINIDSPAANEQALGRLREMDDKSIHPLFVYLICDDIDTHRNYHYNKLPLLKKTCLATNEIFIDQLI